MTVKQAKAQIFKRSLMIVFIIAVLALLTALSKVTI